MGFLAESLRASAALIAHFDPDLRSAVWVSLYVSFWSTILASAIGVPLGLGLGLSDFPLKRPAITALNSLTAVPTVLIGLLVYGFISRQGPLGGFGLLFTPEAIILGDAILAAPIVAGFTLAAARGADPAIVPTALTLGAARGQSTATLVSEIRFGVVAAVVAGFGRVVSEVGVAMMLGGNIRGFSRTMTTAIALETSKGEFALGIALGLVLLAVAFAVNVLLHLLQQK